MNNEEITKALKEIEKTLGLMDSDHAEKPSVVECEVYSEKCRGNVSDTLMFKTDDTGDKGWYLNEAVDHPDFTGFKYEDDPFGYPMPRRYKNPANGEVYIFWQEGWEVLIPTHVILRKATP